MSLEAETLAKNIRRAAMDLLARREQSFAELVRKLVLRFPQDLVVTQVSRLRDEKLQNDDRFTESYIHFRQQKGFGPVRIRSELFQKGIPGDLISEHLVDNHECWMQKACELRIRKFGSSSPSDYKDRVKQMRYLLQRGFSSSQANKSFDQSEHY